MTDSNTQPPSISYFLALDIGNIRYFELEPLAKEKGVWLVLGVRFDISKFDFADNRIKPLGNVDAVLQAEPDVVFILPPGARKECLSLIRPLAKELVKLGSALCPLVRKVPPPLWSNEFAYVRAFACTPDVLRHCMTQCPDFPITSLCYKAVGLLFSELKHKTRVIIRQFPYDAREFQSFALGDNKDTAVILPHKGRYQFLETALASLEKADGKMRCHIGLDEANTAPYENLMQQYKDAHFYGVSPAPSGPYVLRQAMIEQSQEPYLLFHDSDDISTSDRAAKLHAHMHSTGCDFVGSHVLRYDTFYQQLVARRFPLDPVYSFRESVVLDYMPASFLLPSSMLKRSSFDKSSGFSTDLFFGLDSQYIWRESFHMDIRVTDQFLYISRIRPNSLTTSPETGFHSQARKAATTMWIDDFKEVLRERRVLENTSLMPRHSSIPYQVKRLQ